MAALGAKQTVQRDTLLFKIHCVDVLGVGNDLELKLSSHGGDSGEPVFTISEPNED